MSLQDLNVQLILPIIVIQFVLILIALIDLSKRESTRGPKLLWVFIVIFGSILGPVAYFTIGRRNE